MKTWRMAMLLLAGVVGGALGPQAQAQKKGKDAAAMSFGAADPAADDAQVSALINTIYDGIAAGHVEEAGLTPELAARLNSGDTSETRAQFLKLGKLVGLEMERRERQKFSTKYEYLATFGSGQKHIEIYLAPDGKVAHFIFTI